MHKILIKISVICLLSLSLIACATMSMSPRQMSELQQGKRYFDDGFYKRAMRELLPLACEGIPEAQYAVGYMYYYGYGVAQDTDVGYFWIKRAADKHYGPALEAVKMIAARETPKPYASPPSKYPTETTIERNENLVST